MASGGKTAQSEARGGAGGGESPGTRGSPANQLGLQLHVLFDPATYCHHGRHIQVSLHDVRADRRVVLVSLPADTEGVYQPVQIQATRNVQLIFAGMDRVRSNALFLVNFPCFLPLLLVRIFFFQLSHFPPLSPRS